MSSDDVTRATRAGMLLLQPRRPVEHYGKRDHMTEAGRRGEQKAFAVWRDIVLEGVASGALNDPGLEEGLRGSWLKRRFCATARRDRYHSDLAIGSDKEELFAVCAPAGLLTSHDRDLPLTVARGERPDVDLTLAGFIGGVRDPMAIRGTLAEEFIESRVQEGKRFLGLGLVPLDALTKISFKTPDSGRLDEKAMRSPPGDQNGAALRTGLLVKRNSVPRA